MAPVHRHGWCRYALVEVSEVSKVSDVLVISMQCVVVAVRGGNLEARVK